MRVSYLNGKFAIGIMVGAAFTALILLWTVGLNYCPSQPCKYTYMDSQDLQKNSEYGIWNMPNPLRQTFSYRSEPNYSEGNPSRYEYYDLQAQERVALATDWMAWITATTGLLSAIGLFFIIHTLNLQRYAVIAAERATEAAVNAERPHVRFFRTVTDRADGKVIGIKGVTFRNYGRTPALVESIAIRYAFSEKPPLPSTAKKRMYSDDSVMPQDEEWPRKHYAPPLDGEPPLADLFKIIDIDKKRLFVFGELVYRDAFGKRRTTGFCKVWTGNSFTNNQCDVNDQKDLNYAN